MIIVIPLECTPPYRCKDASGVGILLVLKDITFVQKKIHLPVYCFGCVTYEFVKG